MTDLLPPLDYRTMLESMPWRCFHCDEIFHDKQSAQDHFGLDEVFTVEPSCVEASKSDLKSLIATNRELWSRLYKEMQHNEQLEFEVHCWEQFARKVTGSNNPTWHDPPLAWDDMKGQVIAANTLVAEFPRWMQNLARWNYERKWHKERKL